MLPLPVNLWFYTLLVLLQRKIPLPGVVQPLLASALQLRLREHFAAEKMSGCQR